MTEHIHTLFTDTYGTLGLLRWHYGKEPDVTSIPGLGRSPGGRRGNPLWYPCLENPMDGGVLWAIVL